jgi:phage shock protein C
MLRLRVNPVLGDFYLHIDVSVVQGVNMESTKNIKLMRGSTFIAGGVCSGLAHYYGLSKGGIQAAFVISSLVLGFPILVYLVLWLILPKQK